MYYLFYKMHKKSKNKKETYLYSRPQTEVIPLVTFGHVQARITVRTKKEKEIL